MITFAEKEKREREKEEFEKKQANILAPIPTEFHSYFSYLAWEEGHSSGYAAVLDCLNVLLGGFVPVLNEYRNRIVREREENIKK